MSGQHTQGRLEVEGDVILFPPQRGAFRGFNLEGCPNPEANARRLAACWNLLEAFPTEQIEAGIRHMVALTTQRDLLLAALTEARRWIGDGECSDGLAREYWTQEYRAAVDQIDAAIAKATTPAGTGPATKDAHP